MKAGEDHLVERFTVDSALGAMGWFLILDARPVAVSARWYQREDELLTSLALARGGFRGAVVAENAKLIAQQSPPDHELDSRSHILVPGRSR